MNILKKGMSSIAATLLLGAFVASVTYMVMRHNRPKAGIVVMIMGTSSSGKTSIISELKKMCASAFEIVDVDTFTRSYVTSHPMPDQSQLKALDEKAQKKLFEDLDKKLIYGFYALVRDEALKGRNILVDTVPALESGVENEIVSRLLKGIKTIRVLLYCPLDVTIARVEKRNLTGVSSEHREIIQPISQYRLLYKPQDSSSEQILDRVSSKGIKQLVSSSISSFIKNLPKDIKDRASQINMELEEENKNFVKHFRLDALDEVAVVSQKPYDLILNCNNTPKESAEEIVKFLKQQKINLVSNVMKLNQAQIAQFEKYVGKYKLHDDFIITITKESDKLFSQATGQEKLEIFPESETKFFYSIIEAQISFVKDKDGKVTKLILHQGGNDQVAEKIEYSEEILAKSL